MPAGSDVCFVSAGPWGGTDAVRCITPASVMYSISAEMENLILVVLQGNGALSH